jgi:hypothetical protein
MHDHYFFEKVIKSLHFHGGSAISHITGFHLGCYLFFQHPLIQSVNNIHHSFIYQEEN